MMYLSAGPPARTSYLVCREVLQRRSVVEVPPEGVYGVYKSIANFYCDVRMSNMIRSTDENLIGSRTHHKADFGDK